MIKDQASEATPQTTFHVERSPLCVALFMC
jgi:hypothetical protein